MTVTDINNLKELIKTSKFTDAYAQVEPLLRKDPKNADLLDIKAIALCGMQRGKEALAIFESMAKNDLPISTEGALNFAQCLLEDNRHVDAEVLLGQLMQANPNDPRPNNALIRVALVAKSDMALLMHFARSLALQSVTQSTMDLLVKTLKERGRWNTLLQVQAMLVGFFPYRADLWVDISLCHLSQKRIREALTSVTIARQLSDKESPAILNLEAKIHVENQDFEKAYKSLKTSYDIDQSQEGIEDHLAYVLDRLGRYAEAAEMLEKRLAKDSNLASNKVFMTAVAVAHTRNHDYEKAMAISDKCIANDPDSVASLNLKTLIMAYCHQYDEAISMLEEKLTNYAEPPRALFHRYLGILMQSGQHPKALKVSSDYIKDHPDDDDSYIQKSFAALSTRNFKEGWEAYSHRTKVKNSKKYFIQHDGEVWDEKPFDGTLLLIAEQGQGDVTMISRFFPEIRKMVKRLVIEVQEPLVELLRFNFPDCEIYPRKSKLPHYDKQLQMMEILRILDVNDKTMPGKSGYLNWPGGIDFTPQGDFNIAVNWRGERNHPNDKNRSIPLQAMEPLFRLQEKHKGLSIISIQRTLEENRLDNFEWGKGVIKYGNKLKNFCDTAALLKKIDLVVTCDSAPIHMAGATNQAGIVMLNRPCEWRWGTSAEDSYWYDSIKTYRVSKDDYSWVKLVERVAQQIDKKISS